VRVFLDTNVLFSGLYSPAGAPGALLELAATGRFLLCISPDVLTELVRNLRAKAPHLLPLLATFLESVRPLYVEPSGEAVRDRHRAGCGTDAAIIAAALAAEADYFCTGDRRLLRRARRGRLGSLRVASPVELRDLLELEAGPS
jgi:hypothetical protein